MDFSNITTAVTRVAGRQMLVAEKNSPQILFVSGIVGVVGTVVLASKATLGLEAVLDEGLVNKERAAQALALENPKYGDTEYKKDLAIIKVKTAVNIAKLYGPAVLLGVVSIAALASSQNILNKRNVAALGALKVMEGRFNEYRKRVEGELGKEKADELLEGYTVEVDGDNGKKKKVKVSAPLGKSPYAMIFDQHTSTSWRPAENYNQIFLSTQQQWATDRLRSRGYLFLNDVLDQLGMERTSFGQIVGWYYDPENEDVDNYVSFGIFENGDQRGADFVNGIESSVLLDFNIQGQMYELIDKKKR